MARAKNPGVKSTPKKSYHLGVCCECQEGEAMALSEALDLAVRSYKEQCEAQGIRVYQAGFNAFIEQLLRRAPEINEFLKSTKTDQEIP